MNVHFPHHGCTIAIAAALTLVAPAAAQPVEAAARPRLDRHGQPLPPGAIGRLGTTRWRHPFLFNATFSPDGSLLTTRGGGDSSFRVWDARTGQLQREWTTALYGSHVLAFSPDGRLLVAEDTRDRSNPALGLFDIATGKELRRLTYTEPDQALGNPAARPRPRTGEFCRAAFMPDGASVLALDRHEIVVWDVATGQQLRRPTYPRGTFQTMALSANGHYLAAAEGNAIRLLETATGHVVQTAAYPAQHVNALAFARTSTQLAVGDGDGVVHWWDPSGSQPSRVLYRHDCPISALAHSPDGQRLATASIPNTPRGRNEIVLWDLRRDREIRRWRRGYNLHLEFSPDSKMLLSVSANSAAPRFWNAATGEPLPQPVGHIAWIETVATSSDGKTLYSLGWDAQVLRWDLATEEARPAFDTSSEGSFRVAFCENGTRAATWSMTTQELKVWDLTTGRQLRLLGKHDWSIQRRSFPSQALAFSADGRRLASVDQRQVVLWDTVSGEKLRTFTCTDGGIQVQHVALSRDGRKIAARAPDRPGPALAVWDADTGERWRSLPNDKEIATIGFSPDGQRLTILTGEKAVTIWDLNTGKLHRQIQMPDSRADALAFSPDGKLLAGAGEGAGKNIYLWDVATGKELHRFQGFSAFDIAFAADGSFLAAGTVDSTILLLDLTPWRQR